MTTSAQILITGANGNLGKKLLNALAEFRVIAVVRSLSAKQSLQRFVDQQQLHNVVIKQASYTSLGQMSAAMHKVDYVVHLVGIIKQSKYNSFQQAHEQTTQTLMQSAVNAGVQRIFYLSLFGANASASNSCLASRGNAEQILLASKISALVLRIPMVLGQGDYATKALTKQVSKTLGFSFRASSLEQPIYALDLIAAITTDVQRFKDNLVLPSGMMELAGPQSLSRRELRQRAGAQLDKRHHTLSVPLFFGYGLAALMQLLLPNPPFTTEMLGVLDHDDDIDPAAASTALGITLTPLDTMLTELIGRPESSTFSARS